MGPATIPKDNEFFIICGVNDDLCLLNLESKGLVEHEIPAGVRYYNLGHDVDGTSYFCVGDNIEYYNFDFERGHTDFVTSEAMYQILEYFNGPLIYPTKDRSLYLPKEKILF